jgi:signal peptidase I
VILDVLQINESIEMVENRAGPIATWRQRLAACYRRPRASGGAETAATRVGRRVATAIRVVTRAAAAVFFFGTFGFQVIQVDGFSMAPTLEDHDELIVDKLTYEFGDPRPGDVVTLYYPPNPARLYLKRVIAKEGDTVQIVDGRVLVNQQPLRDDYVSPAYRDHGNWVPQVIQQGYDFVMGDHRNNSSDSRDWGFVPKKYILGKVTARWWPLLEARVF